MNAPSLARPVKAGAGISRKAQVLAFITNYLLQHGHSPSIGDIAGAMEISRTRAKALVHQLATEKAIERAPGAQRAISIPGLFDRLVLDRLQADGWKINPTDRTIEAPFPQGHLTLIAELDHLPDVEIGDGDDPGIHER